VDVTDDLPAGRYVDAFYGSWFARAPHGVQEVAAFGTDGPVYVPDGDFDQTLSHAELANRFGPLRPVVPPAGGDAERLRAALRGAGRAGLASLAAVLHRVDEDFSRGEPHQFVSPLTLGHPGSWQSACLEKVTHHIGCGISADRVDQAAAGELTAVLMRWITGPAYTEVAANLAEVCGPLIDELGGFAALADERLAGHPRAAQIEAWMCSRSVKYPPGDVR
jgi:hypothetical protein